MAYSTITLSQNLPFCLLVKQFLKLVELAKLQTNVCRMLDAPHLFFTFLFKDAELARLLVYNRQKLLINVAVLISRLG